MKKLYQGKGRRVHPSPAAVLLPAAVLALASALAPEEQEVLAYLLSCGGGADGRGGRRRRRGPHPPEMGCGCFGCYKSFWARWDASPNRHLIHRIIDAVEEGGGGGGGVPPRRPPRRRRGGRHASDAREDDDADAARPGEADANAAELQGCACDGAEHDDYEGDGDDEEEEGDSLDGDEDDDTVMDAADYDTTNNAGGNATEKSTVGRLVRFIGEKMWGAWN